MAQVQSIRQSWDNVKEWVYLVVGAGFGLTIIWNLWGFFGSLGDTLKEGADSKLSQIRQDSETKTDQVKAKAANGNKIEFTPEQVAMFRQDAETLASYLGRGKGWGMADLLKDQGSAFTMIKQKYSRLLLENNLPYHAITDSKGKKTYHTQTVETKDSIKRAYDWRVLVPFYKEFCDHDLNADFRYYVTDPARTKYFKWIL
jgi:hypothetical protein